jgi:hypothetical protein
MNSPCQQKEALPTRKEDSKDKIKVKDPSAQSLSEPDSFMSARLEPSVFLEEDLDLLTKKNVDNSGRRVETGHIKSMRPFELSLVSENMPVWLLAMENDYCTLLQHVAGHSSPGNLLKAMKEKNIDPQYCSSSLGVGSREVLGHGASTSQDSFVGQWVLGFPQAHSGKMANSPWFISPGSAQPIQNQVKRLHEMVAAMAPNVWRGC